MLSLTVCSDTYIEFCGFQTVALFDFMRTNDIADAKARLSHTIQGLPKGDITEGLSIPDRVLISEGRGRRMIERFAPVGLWLTNQRMSGSVEVPYAFNRMSLDERFADAASRRWLMRRLGPLHRHRVLVPGCYLAGQDVQYWLRHGVRSLDGIDVYDLASCWEKAQPVLREAYGAQVHFQQGSIEDLPFDDGTFDVVATSAVLEHVRNLGAMARETARVLKPSGWAWHAIGPFYTSYGGDHCIAAYGEDAGYDHLLLSEEAYRQRIDDDAFFATTRDPNMPFWARHEQFSFAPSEEYLAHFGAHFELAHVVVKVSQAGLRYRARRPDLWARLRDAGYSESDLLVKGLTVALRKPA